MSIVQLDYIGDSLPQVVKIEQLCGAHLLARVEAVEVGSVWTRPTQPNVCIDAKRFANGHFEDRI